MTTTAKVLRTTTDQEDHRNKEQNSVEITHSGNQSQDEENGRTQPEYQFENSNLLSQESEEPEIEQLTFNSQSSSGQPIAYLCNCLALTLKGCQEWDTI